MCKGPRETIALGSEVGALVVHTCRRANHRIMILVSRCSTPLLSIIRRSRGLPILHGIVHGFCDPLGTYSPCLHFIFLANVAGFSRLDVFDRLGGVGGVDVSRPCTTVYNVAGRRVLRRVNKCVRHFTLSRRVDGRSALLGLRRGCSNCRFA